MNTQMGGQMQNLKVAETYYSVQSEKGRWLELYLDVIKEDHQQATVLDLGNEALDQDAALTLQVAGDAG